MFDEILPSVTKPSRYLGTELNSVHKDPGEVDLRVGLVFPDLYDLGLANLGLHILYAILNDLPWCWAERAYAPAPDMEAALRGRGLPLFAWESKDPLASMDLIGFSMQSELTYTSALNIIDLAGIPLRTGNRDECHPLTFAGGHGTFNPEPMAPFMDFLVIGDGEDVIVEIAEAAREMRGKTRAEKLERFAEIEGVYVPALYPVETLPSGSVVPKQGAPTIAKRVVKDLDGARFPDNYIVPFTQLVHDRAGIEVMRGCTHGCRFCQAGMISRPVRERSLGAIDGLMEGILADTGYEEVSLLSLSTCDYSQVQALLERSAARAHPQRVAVSLPSLRLDTFSVELADAITGVRRSGLTFAPEAGTPRLRALINKCIDDDALIEVATQAFKRGWGHVKLYFMIGLPTERDEDVEAIADLCLRVLEAGRVVSKKARVFTGISTFVPKPFTPFQWAPQIDIDEVRRKHAILKKGLRRHPRIRFGRQEPQATFIEGLIARGDRRAADLIEAAFRNGARLDSSSEFLDFDAWRSAIEQTGFDAAAALRERALDERLPWDHIDVMISKAWLHREWQRAQSLAATSDCRHGDCSQCGLRERVPELCSEMTRVSRQSACAEAARPVDAPAEEAEPPAVQRLRFRIGRVDEARFLSHLELVNAWVRVLRRTRAPLSFSQGFHAHPKVTFATAPPVGEESEADYMDIVLKERVDPQALLEGIRATLPTGFRVYEAAETPLKAPSLMSAVAGFDYTLYSPADFAKVSERVAEILAAETVAVERKRRPSGRRKGKGPVTVNIRPAIRSLTARQESSGRVAVDFTTVAAEGTLAKPREIIQLLGLDPAKTRILKRATHLADDAQP